MNDEKNIYDDSIESTRRKKMDEFRRGLDQNAMSGNYDYGQDASQPASSQPDPVPVSSFGAGQPDAVSYSDDSSTTSYSSSSSSLKRRRRTNEINSFSDSDTKKKIERDSHKALKAQKKEDKRVEKSKAKRNRRIFNWVWLLMIVAVGVVLAQFMIVGMNDVLAISREDDVRTVDISIPENPTMSQIATILQDNGVIDHAEFFELYANFTSSIDGFRQGDFQIDTNKDYEAIINFLQSNNNRTDIVTVQITEGMSVLEIANLLHEQGVVKDKQVFLDACNSDAFDEDYTFLKDIPNAGERYYKLEGYLFPDTYDFYLGEDTELTIDKFLSNFENKIVLHEEKYFGNSKKSSLSDEAEKTGYSTDEILTIASIIQAEAANREDMYYISSIIHNRLDYGVSYGVGMLNLDCTVYYPYREYSDVPETIRSSFTSTYDTNNFNGLPPGPVCNPGEEAIKAAITPYDTEYLFFCHDTVENGSIPYYSTNLADHNYYLSIIG